MLIAAEFAPLPLAIRLPQSLTDRAHQRSGQRLLLAGGQSPRDAPPQDERFGPAGGGRERRLAMQQLPRFRHAPVVDRQTVTGPQREAGQIQPASLMLSTQPATRLDFDQHLPQLAQQRRRPLVTVHAECFDQPLHERCRIETPGRVGWHSGCERLPDDIARRAKHLVVEHPLPLASRIVRGDVSLRRRPDIEQQFPRAFARRFTAPQIERADFGQLRLEDDRDRRRLFRLAGLQHGADRRQRLDLIGIDRDQVTRLVGQPRAGDIQRELDRLRDEQLKLMLRQIDLVPRFNPRR